jgi:predicted nucleic acid-binding protein
MRGVECFLDSNILLYAVSTLPTEAGKAAVARTILDQKDWAWSAQVAAEFINVSTSAKRADRISLVDAESWINTWSAFPCVSIDLPLIKDAIQLAARYQIGYFDAQVVAAARRAGCSVMYSEDLNHGRNYAGVLVTNPFLAATP